MPKILYKIFYLIEFVFFYLLKLIQSNFYIAHDILTPGMRSKPDFIHLPLRIKSDFGLLLFSNLVSMTPGSLSIDISDDKKIIDIHVLYSHDKKKVISEIEEIQSKIKRIIN